MPAKVATLLPGGLMRGVFQGGVCYALEELEEAGVLEHGDIITVSVGLCSGKFYATRSARRASTIWRNDVHGDQLIFWRWGRPRMRTRHLLECFRQHLPVLELGQHGTLLCVLTDLERGEPVYTTVTPTSPIWRIELASIAIPPIVETVEIAGRSYADGGLTDPLPIRWMIAQGYRDITVVLTRPFWARDRIWFNWLVSPLILRKFPRARRAFRSAATRYNAALALIQNPPPGVRIRVICPPDLTVGRLCTDREKLLAWWRSGYQEAYRTLGKELPRPPF